MDINRLHYFCVVAETGSMRRASELLNLSPPALSKAVKILEDEVGYPLVLAEGRGILITDEGRKLVSEAQPLLDKLDDLKKIPERSKGKDEGELIKIGSFEVFSTYFLGEAIQREFKNERFQVLELVPGQLEESLCKHEIDIGITYIPIPTSGLDYLKVCKIQMGVYGKKSIDLKSDQVTHFPFAAPITPVEGSPTKVQGLDGWPDHDVPRNLKYKVTMMETALDLCRRGLAIGYYPKFVVELHNQMVDSSMKLKEYPLPKGMKIQTQDVYILKRKTDIENRSIKKLAKCLRTITSSV